MKADIIEYEQMKRECCLGVDSDGEGDARFVDAEKMEDVREDRRALVIYLRKSCKRRAYPPWGLPSEMALMRSPQGTYVIPAKLAIELQQNVGDGQNLMKRRRCHKPTKDELFY